MERAAKWARAARADALVFGLQAVVFVPIALHRFVDGDEGVYAYASRLAIHGKVPYRDFFYEQMPLLPYVYGAWISLTGESWPAVRLLSAIFATFAGTLLYRHVRLRLGQLPALVALVLYLASGLVLAYLTIVKTFTLTTLLVLSAYVLAANGGTGARRFVAAGALAGLAVETRLVAAAALLILLVVSVRARRAAPFAVGAGAALVPSVVLLALDSQSFLFDNLRYHALKSSGGLVGDVHEKAQTAATLLGLEPTDRELGIQFLLLVAACAAVTVLPRLRSRAAVSLALAISLAVASLLPTPTYVQYFALTVPFLAISAAELAAAARSRSAVVALAAGLCAYTAAGVAAVDRFTEHDALLRPSLDSVRRASATIQSATAQNEIVVSAWPGYLFGTHARALPDYTNQFAPVAAAEISSATARHVHVVSEQELERRLRDGEVRLVVYRNWVTSPPFARWDAALAAGGYRLVATVQTARIYRR